MRERLFCHGAAQVDRYPSHWHPLISICKWGRIGTFLPLSDASDTVHTEEQLEGSMGKKENDL